MFAAQHDPDVEDASEIDDIRADPDYVRAQQPAFHIPQQHLPHHSSYSLYRAERFEKMSKVYHETSSAHSLNRRSEVEWLGSIGGGRRSDGSDPSIPVYAVEMGSGCCVSSIVMFRTALCVV